MFETTGELIVTPWSCDSEWQLVRQDIYACKDTRNYERALRKLQLWKSRGKSLPRGLYCTELILQVIVKDNHFCNVKGVVNENDLVHLYSMAVMKFVNLTADVLGKGLQKSMYFRASCVELPSWLIDMRHKISHDKDLPTLQSLRVAMEFALEWLQTKYWNEDKNFQVAGLNLNLDVVDNFSDLLELYVLSNVQIDSDLKRKRFDVLIQKLFINKFSNKKCIQRIKELLENDAWSSQLVNVFVTRYLLQSKECKMSKGRISKFDKRIWSVLLKISNTIGLFTNVLQCLVTQNSYIAALWVIELCLMHKSNTKIDPKYYQNDNYINCKPLHLDTGLVLKSALNSTHPYTTIFIKWLLQIQSNPLKEKQQYNIVKLVSLYTGSAKTNSKYSEQNIFTVNNLMEKIGHQHQSKWSLAFGQLNWRQIPLGTTL